MTSEILQVFRKLRKEKKKGTMDGQGTIQQWLIVLVKWSDPSFRLFSYFFYNAALISLITKQFCTVMATGS